jgi:hypothetical protein
VFSCASAIVPARATQAEAAAQVVGAVGVSARVLAAHAGPSTMLLCAEPVLAESGFVMAEVVAEGTGRRVLARLATRQELADHDATTTLLLLLGLHRRHKQQKHRNWAGIKA